MNNDVWMGRYEFHPNPGPVNVFEGVFKKADDDFVRLSQTRGVSIPEAELDGTAGAPTDPAEVLRCMKLAGFDFGLEPREDALRGDA